MKFLRNINDRARINQLANSKDLETSYDRRMEIRHLRNNITSRNMKRYQFKGWKILIYVIISTIMLIITLLKLSD